MMQQLVLTILPWLGVGVAWQWALRVLWDM